MDQCSFKNNRQECWGKVSLIDEYSTEGKAPLQVKVYSCEGHAHYKYIPQIFEAGRKKSYLREFRRNVFGQDRSE